MTDSLSPPKYIAKHWPKQSERELIEEFLDWAADPENGGAELRQYVVEPDERVARHWEEAPRSEILESFFAAREQ